MPGAGQGFLKLRNVPGKRRKLRKGGPDVVVVAPRRRKLRTGNPTAVAQVVRDVISRSTETKYISQYVTTSGLQTGVAPFLPAQWENAVQAVGQNVDAQYWSVALPAMVQSGTSSTTSTDWTRLGDRVEPKAHHLKMTMRFTPQFIDGRVAQAVPLDCTAYIFYGYIRSMKTFQGSAAIGYKGNSIVVEGQNEATRAMTHLLMDGDGTFTTFTGDPAIAQLPLSDYVNMKVKKIHFRRAAGWINTSAGNGGATPNSDSQNTISKQITLKFNPPAKLDYRTSTDVYPENYAPVYAVGYVYNDATASGNNASPAYGQGSLEYIAMPQLWFKDHQ